MMEGIWVQMSRYFIQISEEQLSFLCIMHWSVVKNHKEFKRKLGLNKCRILFFGGIAKIKGFIYFLNVFCVVMKLIPVRSFQRHVNEGFDQKYENYF